jgi:hypothetical protein
VAALGKAGLKALEALRSRLPAAGVPGIQFTREVPTPRPPSTPFKDVPEPPAIRRRELDAPREVTIPRITDELDPVTGLPVIKDMKHTVKPMPGEAFEEFDALFRTDRENTILALFSEIENVENFDRLYLVTELMRRYRPQMHPRQARVLEQSLEEAAQRLGVPPRIGKMDMFSYTVPEASTAPVSSRTFGSGKALLDEVNALGGKVNSKTADPIEIIASLNRYDKGQGGGIFGNAVARGTAGDAADQRLIQNQINYWRRTALQKAGLEEEAFTGIRGLRYTADMSEADAYKRTLAALRSATTEDEVAMIVAQSRGRIVSPNYTDVIDDLASRMVLDIAGNVPFDAQLSGLGRPVPGGAFYLGRVDDVVDVDDFFVQNPFIGPLMQSPVGVRSIQGMLRRAGLPELPEELLRKPAARAAKTRGVNIESVGPTFKEFGGLSPIEELGSATSGPIGYGPVFRGLEDPFGPVAAARRVAAGEGVGLIKPSFVNKGTDVQKRWANKFAESRMQQLVSDDPRIRAEAAQAMREAIRNDWVEPSLLEEMRRIVKQPARAARSRLLSPSASQPAQGWAGGESKVKALKPEQKFEVSSRGDKRFSAGWAEVDGRTIEDIYQVDIKGGVKTGSGRFAYSTKGNPPAPGSLASRMTADEQYEAYKDLWRKYFDQNPEALQEVARKSQGKVLTDIYGSGDVNQARAIHDILTERGLRQMAISSSSPSLVTPTATPTPPVAATADFSTPPPTPSVNPGAGKIIQPDPSTNQGYRSYVPRTIENAQSSDITIAVARDFETAGERLTYEAARGARRAEFGRNPRQPNLDYDHWYSVSGSEGQFGTPKPIAQIPHMSQDMGQYIDNIVESLNQVAAQTGRPVTINGAGNGIARIGNQAEADTYARHIISRILEHPNRNFEIGLVRSGGQNGYDIAFNKAAKVYGIPTEINPSYHPSGLINIQLPNGKSTQIRSAEYVRRYRLDTGDIGELSS